MTSIVQHNLEPPQEGHDHRAGSRPFIFAQHLGLEDLGQRAARALARPDAGRRASWPSNIDVGRLS